MNPLQTFELEYNDAGDTFTTSCWQLLQWKHALSLECVGMTMSRGRKVSSHLKRLMKLKRNTPVRYLQAWVNGALDAAVKAQS